MWGGVSVHGLYPHDGPLFRDDILNSSAFKRWQKNENLRRKGERRDVAFWILTESGLEEDIAEDYPNGGIIYREDYQRSFKAKVRFADTKEWLRDGAIGEVYPSYSNGEKERLVCKPSREHGIHDGFSKKKQAVKMADIWGQEKVWSNIYESCRQHGDFKTLRSKMLTSPPCNPLTVSEK